ncbi:diadenylate cyclase CdaA [Treponema sp. Marseille-Q3903]|uniref:diadenylate cyclase CdaA n=1 Tax=Treponema sp. Marseille-Q3903 TaxID=2766703 RepID=UPI0016527F34|nr:diadenylate cyclase CdaA [Treponema sp. Marseille-Q3903]MBC6713800.1 TIGR00159 family protein [Treponema sp. Marseille-Q3903]
MLGFDRILYLYDFVRPVLDIAVLTFILFKAYDFISKTNGVQMLKAFVIVGVAYGIAVILDLRTLLWLLNIIAPGLVIAFALIFQPEIRKLFIRIGQNGWFAFGSRSKHTYVDAVLIAAEMLSKQRRGMLAVFTRHTQLENIIQTGTILNADLSSSLLMTIFGKDTSLHDGACFIQGGKLIAAGCFLPTSDNYSIKKTFGTRHRAALGLSEVSDAVVLVVSEETGALSLAYDSKLNYDLSVSEVRKVLENLLEITSAEKTLEDTVDEHENTNN